MQWPFFVSTTVAVKALEALWFYNCRGLCAISSFKQLQKVSTAPLRRNAGQGQFPSKQLHYPSCQTLKVEVLSGLCGEVT